MVHPMQELFQSLLEPGPRNHRLHAPRRNDWDRQSLNKVDQILRGLIPVTFSTKFPLLEDRYTLVEAADTVFCLPLLHWNLFVEHRDHYSKLPLMMAPKWGDRKASYGRFQDVGWRGWLHGCERSWSRDVAVTILWAIILYRMSIDSVTWAKLYM